jgi:large subunit ribosomal protein L25
VASAVGEQSTEMQRIELQVTKRSSDVSAASLRREGQLPGVLYGAGGENIQVTCDAATFGGAGLGSSGAHLIRFASDEGSLNANVVLVKEIQTHPVQGYPIHVDFLRIDLKKPVEASIAIHLTGKCAGVVEGGILQPLRRELDVRALPDKLPESIDIDVTELNIHDSIHLEDLTLPEGVEARGTENFTIVTVLPPVVEEAATEAEGADGAVAAAPAEGADAPAADADAKEGD